MKNKITFIAVFLMALSTSCKIAQVMPYYTEPSKLAQLQAGMSLGQINTTLGIEPHNLYHIQADGSSVIVYNYRIKERRAVYTAGELKKNVPNSLDGQTRGKEYYDEVHKAYILLKDGKLLSLITDKGMEESKAIVVSNNLLKLISGDELIDYQTRIELWNEADGEKNIQLLKDKGEIVIPINEGSTGEIKSINLDLK